MDNKIIPFRSYAPYFQFSDNDFFSMKIGGTVYEVTTHFNTAGKEIVLQQFYDMLLELQCI